MTNPNLPAKPEAPHGVGSGDLLDILADAINSEEAYTFEEYSSGRMVQESSFIRVNALTCFRRVIQKAKEKMSNRVDSPNPRKD